MKKKHGSKIFQPLSNFYPSGFSDYSLHFYIHNVSTEMSSGLLQESVELGASKHVFYLIHWGHLF